MGIANPVQAASFQLPSDAWFGELIFRGEDDDNDGVLELEELQEYQAHRWVQELRASQENEEPTDYDLLFSHGMEDLTAFRYEYGEDLLDSTDDVGFILESNRTDLNSEFEISGGYVKSAASFELCDPFLGGCNGANQILLPTPPDNFELPPPDTSYTPIPVFSIPLPSTPLPSIPLPSTPLPSTPLPSIPLPSTPLPSTPLPTLPLPSTPLPSDLSPISVFTQANLVSEASSFWGWSVSISHNPPYPKPTLPPGTICACFYFVDPLKFRLNILNPPLSTQQLTEDQEFIMVLSDDLADNVEAIPSASVPEPNSTLVLMFLGSVGLLKKIKKK